MKKIITKVISGSALFTFFAVSTFAQTTATTTTKADGKKKVKIEKTKVPKVVTETFYGDYPATTYESWYGYPTFDNDLYWYDYDPFFYSNDYPEYYVVDFTKNNGTYKAVYAKSGKKIAIHKKLTDLPKAVSSAISSGTYKTWTVAKDKEEIFKDKDSDQLKVYKVEVEKGKDKHTLYFQPDGKLLKDKVCTK
jgi:hypothetical protein